MQTIKLILVRSSGQRIRLPRASNWILRFGAAVDPDELLEQIREYFRYAWSCEVHALRWLFPNDLFVAQRGAQPYLILHVDIPGHRFLSGTPLVVPDAISLHRALKSIPVLSHATRSSPFQPWSEPGWLHRNAQWLVRRLGSAAVREIRQVRVNATGAVIKLTGCMGILFFKALPPFLAYETRLLTTLRRNLPDICAVVFRIPENENAHITFAIDGCSLATINGLDKWKVTLAGVSRMQIAASPYVRDFRLAGVPFQTISNLSRNLEKTMNDLLSMGARASNRLTGAELQQISALTAMAREDLEHLGECGLPETIVHGDLNESNVFLTPTNQTKFIDWSFSRLGHPFFALDDCLFSTFSKRHRMFKEHEQLCDAYIEPWQEYASRNLLLSSLRAAHRLIPLEAAISIVGPIRELEAYEPGNVRHIPLLLRRALARYGLPVEREVTACG